MTDFVSLHHHTSYSVCDALSPPKAHTQQLDELGYDHVCFTEHGSLSSMVQGLIAAEQYQMEYIVGCELYVSYKDLDHTHSIVWVKNEEGWQNLLDLIYQAEPSVGRDGITRIYIPVDELLAKSEGLITSTTCAASAFNRLIQQDRKDEFEDLFEKFAKTFGDDFYIELHNHGIDIEEKANEIWIDKVDKTDVKPIAVHDVHYVEKDHKKAHDFLYTCRFKGSKGDLRSFPGENSFYIHSYEETIERFSEFPCGEQAVHNTLEIAEKCKFTPSLYEDHMPSYQGEKDSLEAFREKYRKGFEKRYPDKDINEEPYKSRLEKEDHIITQMGYVDYFLIVSDIVEHARQKGIVAGAGRGSGCSSLIAYCMGITAVDPIKYDLSFARFLNRGRTETRQEDFGI